MDRQLKLLPEFLRGQNRKGCACGNAEPEIWQRRSIFHFAERLIEKGHAGKNCCLAASEIIEDRARRSVVADNHWHTAHNQWCKQIAEPIGVRDWNDGEIQIVTVNSHRVANLIAIRQKLFTPKADQPRGGRRSRR